MELPKRKFRALLASSVILLLLVLSAPVNAITVHLSLDGTQYNHETGVITLTGSIDIQDWTDFGLNPDILPITNLTINLTGAESKECTFFLNGTKISGCSNVEVSVTQAMLNYSYGYGFGYGYGFDRRYGQEGYNVQAPGNTTQEYFVEDPAGSRILHYGYGYSFYTGYSYGSSDGAEFIFSITWNLTAEGMTSGNYSADFFVDTDEGEQTGLFNHLQLQTFSVPSPPTFLVDVTKPSISLSSPANTSYVSSPSLTFTPTDDNSTTTNCTYNLDGINYTLGPIANNTSNSTSLSLSTGQHSANITCTDYLNNTLTTSTVYFSKTTVTSSIATVSAGAVTTTNATTVNQTPVVTTVSYENLTLQNITAGETEEIALNKTNETSIKSVKVKTKKDIENATVNVQTLAERPQATTAISTAGFEAVYRYLEFTSSISDDDLEKVTISFELPKSWLEDNNYLPEQVKLLRFVNSIWTELDTSAINSDSLNYYFEATSSGFSYYAIVVTEKQAPSEEIETPFSVDIADNETIQTIGEEITGGAVEEVILPEEEAKGGKSGVVTYVILALSLFALGGGGIILFLILRKRKLKGTISEEELSKSKQMVAPKAPQANQMMQKPAVPLRKRKAKATTTEELSEYAEELEDYAEKLEEKANKSPQKSYQIIEYARSVKVYARKLKEKAKPAVKKVTAPIKKIVRPLTKEELKKEIEEETNLEEAVKEAHEKAKKELDEESREE